MGAIVKKIKLVIIATFVLIFLPAAGFLFADEGRCVSYYCECDGQYHDCTFNCAALCGGDDDNEAARIAEEQRKAEEEEKKRQAKAKFDQEKNEALSELKGIEKSGSENELKTADDAELKETSQAGEKKEIKKESSGMGFDSKLVFSVSVDAQAALAKLPKQAELIEKSPGSREARKGFVCIAFDQDWPAALAWYRQALLKDKNNPELLRMVELCNSTIEFRKKYRLPLIGDAPYVKAKDLNAEFKKKYNKGVKLIEQPRKKPPKAFTEMERKLDAAYARFVDEYLADEAGKEAMLALYKGKTGEAVKGLEKARGLAPWVKNYQDVIDGIKNPGKK